MAFIFPVEIYGIQDRGIFLSMNAFAVTFMPCFVSASQNGPEGLGEGDWGGSYSNQRRMAEKQHPPDVQRFAKDVVEEMKTSENVLSFEELLNRALDTYFSQEEFTDEEYDEDQINATVNTLSKALLSLTSKVRNQIMCCIKVGQLLYKSESVYATFTVLFSRMQPSRKHSIHWWFQLVTILAWDPQDVKTYLLLISFSGVLYRKLKQSLNQLKMMRIIQPWMESLIR